MTALVWFREDLRIHDNPALFFASRQSVDGVIGVYIFNSQFAKEHSTASCRVEFVLRGLKSLQTDLDKLNIPLIFLQEKYSKNIPTTLLRLCRQYSIEAVFFNRQYEIDEKRLDNLVENLLRENRVESYSYDDQTILPPGSVKTKQEGYYKIFTPYRAAWLKKIEETDLKILPSPKKQKPILISTDKIPQFLTGFKSSVDPELWPAGEKAAVSRLRRFIIHHLACYHLCRDLPGIPGTSQLSPYLAAGMISARQCYKSAKQAVSRQKNARSGADVWISELIWRDYYKNLLIVFPRLSMHKPYLVKTDQLPWSDDKKLFDAWAEGKTGFPIIDAAMRQLNTTGWMHNRLRMIAASFLVKNLMIDWRLGEQYFMSHLIDGDLAANNGNWQWCASTGVDAQLYSRIFNPVRQSHRFDPRGDFIRRFCPELKSLDNKVIHDPSQFVSQELQHLGYCKAIVDLNETRRYFTATYRKFVL